MFTKEQVILLRNKVGRLVTVTIKEENTIINPGSHILPEPKFSKIEHNLELVGIYGIDRHPLFILGRDKKGKEFALRNLHWTTAEKETGIENFRHKSFIFELDQIPILETFKEAYSRISEDKIAHLLGYRNENVQGNIVKLNWGTIAKTDDEKVIQDIKKLVKII